MWNQIENVCLRITEHSTIEFDKKFYLFGIDFHFTLNLKGGLNLKFTNEVFCFEMLKNNQANLVKLKTFEKTPIPPRSAHSAGNILLMNF